MSYRATGYWIQVFVNYLKCSIFRYYEIEGDE